MATSPGLRLCAGRSPTTTKQTFDYDLSPRRVCITDGASGALTIAMAMLMEAGAELVLPMSCYPAYRVLAQIFNAKVRLAPVTEAGRIDVERLPARLSRQSRALLINSPSNPHGTYLERDALEAVAGLGVPTVFDEVYQPLPLGEETIPSAIQHADRHMIVGSLSKSLSIAGLRVGYLIVPESQVARMTNIKAVLNMCTSLPSQVLAEQLLRHWPVLIDRHRAMLRRNWALFRAAAERLGLRLRTEPQAGFFAMVDCGGVDAGALAMDLARHQALGSTPGCDFQDGDNAFLRLSFACPAEQIEPGLRRLAACLHQSPMAQPRAALSGLIRP
jgi:aspartate/methionine/tyrosine aminotransferase